MAPIGPICDICQAEFWPIPRQPHNPFVCSRRLLSLESSPIHRAGTLGLGNKFVSLFELLVFFLWFKGSLGSGKYPLSAVCPRYSVCNCFQHRICFREFFIRFCFRKKKWHHSVPYVSAPFLLISALHLLHIFTDFRCTYFNCTNLRLNGALFFQCHDAHCVWRTVYKHEKIQ